MFSLHLSLLWVRPTRPGCLLMITPGFESKWNLSWKLRSSSCLNCRVSRSFLPLKMAPHRPGLLLRKVDGWRTLTVRIISETRLVYVCVLFLWLKNKIDYKIGENFTLTFISTFFCYHLTNHFSWISIFSITSFHSFFISERELFGLFCSHFHWSYLTMHSHW